MLTELVLFCVFFGDLVEAVACANPSAENANYGECCQSNIYGQLCSAFCGAHSDLEECILLTCDGYADCCTANTSAPSCQVYCKQSVNKVTNDCKRVQCDNNDTFTIIDCCPDFGKHDKCCAELNSSTCETFCKAHPTEGACITQYHEKCIAKPDFEECCQPYPNTTGEGKIPQPIFHPVCDDFCETHSGEPECIKMRCERTLNTATCCPVFNLSIALCRSFCDTHKTSGECAIEYQQQCNENDDYSFCCSMVGIDSSICTYYCQNHLDDINCLDRSNDMCRASNKFDVCCESYQEICDAWCESNPKDNSCILLKGVEPVAEAAGPADISILGPLILIIVLGIVFIIVAVVIFFLVLYYLKLGCFESKKDDDKDIETGVNEIMASVVPPPSAIDLKETPKIDMKDTTKTAEMVDTTKSANDAAAVTPVRKSTRKSTRKSVKKSVDSTPSQSVTPKLEATTTTTRKSLRKSVRKSVKK